MNTLTKLNAAAGPPQRLLRQRTTAPGQMEYHSDTRQN